MPKGYNERAIKGQLEFLRGCFECILEEVRAGKPIKQALKEELEEIERRLKDDYRPTSVQYEETVAK